MSDESPVRWDTPREGVGRATLARAEKRNAQDKAMLYELDARLSSAMGDPDIRVVVIAADGPDFSSGHDLSDRSRLSDFRPVSASRDVYGDAQHGQMAVEEEIYLGMCWRWRNLPKPTIVSVQGRAIAGGLMLVWPFDLIVASDDAEFSDPVVAFGVNGHEYFVHAYEVGPRKAKEMLFAGETLTAQECLQLGMVNRVAPRHELEMVTLDLAERIARRPAFGLRLAKQAVNNTMDIQGQWSAIQSAFALHHLGHAQARLIHDYPVDPAGLTTIRSDLKDRERAGQS